MDEILAPTPFQLDPKTNSRFRAETLAAWQNYESTGLHLTGEEVDEWLGKLEDGKIVDPPTCHP